MKIFTALFLCLFSFSVFSQSFNNCYSIAAGKNATSTKNVIIGHNEDDCGNMIINMYKVPEIRRQNSVMKLSTGYEIPQVDETNKLFWIETTQEEFGDFYMNQWGVTICSDACQSKEDTAKGILTYDFRRIIAERAHNSNEAVEIAGKLIEKYGYGNSGRTYIIADAFDVWLFSVVQGKRWVARRVPDDEVAIIPNYYTIGEIDLADSANFRASPDIISYAVTRGWYNPESDKEFNFRRVYGSKSSLNAIWNIPRHQIGIDLLSKEKINLNDTFVFSFVPKSKLNIEDFQVVLESHFENDDKKNVHDHSNHPICNKNTKFSLIVEFKNTYPENNQNVIWFAPLNPCVNPYVPIHFKIDSFPAMYSNRKWEEANQNHFKINSNTHEECPNHAFSIFSIRRNYIDTDYEKLSISAKIYKNHFEKYAKDKFIANPNGQTSYELLMELYAGEKNFKR